MQQPNNLHTLTLSAIEAALQAGELLRQGFGTHFTISSKEGRHNLVTEYDFRAEKMIIDFLKKSTPQAHFLAEESGDSGKTSELIWIIDPLDGTVNFAHELPCFSVSIAARKKGETICGVVYQPITHELFIAEKNQGAYLNGKRLSVSKTKNLEQSFLATGFPYNLADNPLDCIGHFTDILRLGVPVRRLGSAAIDLAYTAAGRFDGFFEVSLQPWDCAAGLLLIEEAGGKTTQWDERPFDLFGKGPILASNGLIHEALSKVLQQK